jgi:uncharacterized membrane protein YhaH (DUF805 family)
MSQQSGNYKLFWGMLLMLLTPVFIFVKPTGGSAILRDVVLLIWWALIIWLLITGRKKSNQTGSK